jgi:hypothetical protein
MCPEFKTHIASVGAGLNPESETSNGEAGDAKVDPPSPGDQGPNGGSLTDKPKREYRSTPEGREAKRRSLEEVRKATPKEVLHRDTPRRRAATIASLGLAQERDRL